MGIIFIIMTAVVIIAVLLLIVAGAKAEPEKGGEDMIKRVYVYLVLFATLMMTIGGSVSAFMAAADIISPVTYQQTFEEYKRYGGKVISPEGEEEKLTEEELRENYEAMVASEKERQAARAKNNLIKSFGWIIIPLPVFVYYQRRLGKKEE